MKRYCMELVIIGVLVTLSGCMSTLSGESYSRNEARKEQRVEFGRIEYIRPVVIEGTKTPIGAGTGAVVGGIAGSGVGGGKGQDVATVVGAVAGGLAGAAAEEQLTKKQGVELTVRLNNGSIIAVVQEVSSRDRFNVGDQVRVLTLGGTTRVAQ
jgi:outer membrane lipoprotein SlyB